MMHRIDGQHIALLIYLVEWSVVATFVSFVALRALNILISKQISRLPKEAHWTEVASASFRIRRLFQLVYYFVPFVTILVMSLSEESSSHSDGRWMFFLFDIVRVALIVVLSFFVSAYERKRMNLKLGLRPPVWRDQLVFALINQPYLYIVSSTIVIGRYLDRPIYCVLIILSTVLMIVFLKRSLAIVVLKALGILREASSDICDYVKSVHSQFGIEDTTALCRVFEVDCTQPNVYQLASNSRYFAISSALPAYFEADDIKALMKYALYKLRGIDSNLTIRRLVSLGISIGMMCLPLAMKNGLWLGGSISLILLLTVIALRMRNRFQETSTPKFSSEYEGKRYYKSVLKLHELNLSPLVNISEVSDSNLFDQMQPYIKVDFARPHPVDADASLLKQLKVYVIGVLIVLGLSIFIVAAIHNCLVAGH